MTLVAWLSIGPWRDHPGRAAVAVLALAIGVALGLSIDLVNRSALAEFSRAISVVNGEAQLRVSATAGSIDEALYPLLARHAGVAAASPVIETQAQLADPVSPDVRSLRIVGLDVFQAALVSPGLMPSPAAQGGSATSLFADDAIFLSEAALQQLGRRVGDTLRLRVGTGVVALTVAGTVPGAAAGQAIGIADVATVQWRLRWLGRLSRVDLRLQEGADTRVLVRELQALVGPQAVVAEPSAAEQRMSNLSRAYRVNLNVLALVALFTGGFIVYSTMLLAIARQLASLALLGILGASRRQLAAVVLVQGAALGTLGAVAGIAGGIALAKGMLAFFGGDLGGGYFGRSVPQLALSPGMLTLFGLLGVSAGVAGSVVPAWRLARMEPVRTLRAGPLALESGASPSLRWAATWGVAGGALSLAPPVAGLPLPAYAAIAAWLLAGIAAVPWLVTRAVQAAGFLEQRAWGSAGAWLALRRLSGSPGAGASALAGVVASFALASAMVIMVASFRDSVEHWLEQVLPADVYGRAGGSSGAAGAIDATLQQALRSLPGVARAEFMRTLELDLQPERPAVMLIARSIDRDQPQARLPLSGATYAVAPSDVPVWVSEPMVDLYRLAPGTPLSLPIGDGRVRFVVAGVWRDYARQHGAVAMALDDYQRLTGDTTVNEFSLWVRNGESPDDARGVLRSGGGAFDALDVRSAGELRALSLRIFDRSFALTYVLEALAIVVGLVGASATFAGDALARAREFALSEQLGLARRQLTIQLATESAALLTVGVAWGSAIGAAIAVLLVQRVNPQSFHWTMEMSWPLDVLVVSGLALVVLGTLASTITARRVVGDGSVALLREDW